MKDDAQEEIDHGSYPDRPFPSPRQRSPSGRQERQPQQHHGLQADVSEAPNPAARMNGDAQDHCRSEAAGPGADRLDAGPTRETNQLSAHRDARHAAKREEKVHLI